MLAVDVFWVIDLGINFTTGYRDATHVLHSSARSNARRYLQHLNGSLVSCGHHKDRTIEPTPIEVLNPKLTILLCFLS